MPKKGLHCLCILVIITDIVFEMGKDYYLQVFLEKCKYKVKEKKISRCITDNTNFFSNDKYDDSSKGDSEEKY